jgi:hypothetical protein
MLLKLQSIKFNENPIGDSRLHSCVEPGKQGGGTNLMGDTHERECPYNEATLGYVLWHSSGIWPL